MLDLRTFWGETTTMSIFSPNLTGWNFSRIFLDVPPPVHSATAVSRCSILWGSCYQQLPQQHAVQVSINVQSSLLCFNVMSKHFGDRHFWNSYFLGEAQILILHRQMNKTTNFSTAPYHHCTQRSLSYAHVFVIKRDSILQLGDIVLQRKYQLTYCQQEILTLCQFLNALLPGQIHSNALPIRIVINQSCNSQ